MTCDDCRAAFATAEPLALLESPAVREHCRSCPACQHAAAVIADGHREAVRIFHDTGSALTDSAVIERAVALAERRQRGRIAFLVIAVVLVPLAAVVVSEAVRPAVREVARAVQSDQVTVTIPLRCLSSDRAGQLISPYVRSHGSVYYTAAAPLRVITVKATAAEAQRVREVLSRFDGTEGGACAIPPASAPTAR